LKTSFPSPFKRWLAFAIWALLSFLIFARPIYALIQLANRDDTYSYVLLIPFISAWLLYLDRKQPQVKLGFSVRPALLFLIVSLLAFFASLKCASCSAKDHLILQVLALILLLVGGFLLILGARKARASSFALAFLLLTVPIPDVILDKAIYGLRAGSAEIAEVLFNLSGVPVLREGFVFRLPKISIEVAQECSGIRSSLALLILALLVAQFSFRPFWKKLVFLLAGLCVMLVKNGIRIVSLTLLGNYVDPDFLYGNLHHRGGVVFFLIGLALLLPLYWSLRKGETGTAGFGGQTAGGIGAARNP
jgi:exosortase